MDSVVFSLFYVTILFCLCLRSFAKMVTRILTLLPLSPHTIIGHVPKAKLPPPFFPSVKCLAYPQPVPGSPHSPAAEIAGPGGGPLNSGTSCNISAPRKTEHHLLPDIVSYSWLYGSMCRLCPSLPLPGFGEGPEALLAATAYRNAVAACQYTFSK